MEVSATAKNIGISPKKLRPLVAAVRGRPVEEALNLLQVLPTPAAGEVAKAIRSAAANAENNLTLDRGSLRVVAISANPGLKLRRMMPHPRGRAGLVLKRHSHITVTVSDEED